MLGYHIKHQLLLKKIRSFLWREKLPWQQESPAKTGLSCSYLKNELDDPHFLRMKLCAKFKKFCGAYLVPP